MADDDRTTTGDEPERKPAADDAERERLERKFGWGPGDVIVRYKNRKEPQMPNRSPWLFEIDPSLTDEEKAALNAKTELFMAYFHEDVYWSVSLDDKGRRYLQAMNYHNRNGFIVEIILDDLAKLPEDQGTFNHRINYYYRGSKMPNRS